MARSWRSMHGWSRLLVRGVIAALPAALIGCSAARESVKLDENLAARSDVVLVVSHAADEGGSKFHTWTAHTDRVLKSPPPPIPPIATDLRFAMYGWDPDVPPEPVALYLIYFDAAARKDMRAIGWRTFDGAGGGTTQHLPDPR